MSNVHIHGVDSQPIASSLKGFRWVAEWQPHAATWIAWPHNLNTWPNRFENIPATFDRLIRTLAEVEAIHVLGGPKDSSQIASDTFEDNAKITVHPIETNDCWIRDFGPTFLLDQDGSELAAVDWIYNAWGGKYPPFDDDAQNSQRICEIVGCKRIVSRMVCEGGSLETDGAGTLLTTSRCLLSMSRNPDWSRAMVEEELKVRL